MNIFPRLTNKHGSVLLDCKTVKNNTGITEQLKANSPMEWVRKMNCIRQQADESVFAEIIYK